VGDVGKRLAGIIGHVQVIAQRVPADLRADTRLGVPAADRRVPGEEGKDPGGAAGEVGVPLGDVGGPVCLRVQPPRVGRGEDQLAVGEDVEVPGEQAADGSPPARRV
jgi:hypothetical protein